MRHLKPTHPKTPDLTAYIPVVLIGDQIVMLETTPAEATREAVIAELIGGGNDYEIVAIQAINLREGWTRDASEEIAHEIYATSIRYGVEIISEPTTALLARFGLEPYLSGEGRISARAFLSTSSNMKAA